MPVSRSESPALSIIIASYNARWSIATCLDSLRLQKTSRIFETILVDSSTDGTADLVRQRYPEVQLITSSSRLFPGAARNLGLQGGPGQNHRLPRHRLLRGTRLGWTPSSKPIEPRTSLVSGVVLNGTPDRRVAWAYYFCEFSHWLPGGAIREIPEAAGCCLSFKREAYEAYGPFVEGPTADTAFPIGGPGGMVIRSIWTLPSASFTGRTINVRDYLNRVAYHRRFYARVKVGRPGWDRLADWPRCCSPRRCSFSSSRPLGPVWPDAAASSGEFLDCLPWCSPDCAPRLGGEFLGFLITVPGRTIRPADL